MWGLKTRFVCFIYPICNGGIACFQWKHSGRVVFIFSSKTRVLVWCGLKQAEYGPKTSYVSDPRVSLGENVRFQKWAFSACFQAENDPFINSGTGQKVQRKIAVAVQNVKPLYFLSRSFEIWEKYCQQSFFLSKSSNWPLPWRRDGGFLEGGIREGEIGDGDIVEGGC